MGGLKAMFLEADEKMGIKCRFISEWFKIDSYIYPTREGLLLTIKRNKPDIVFMDLNLYSKIDGIKTTQTIRYRFGIPVLYLR